MYHTCSINCCCSVSSRLALPQATTDEPAGTTNEMNLKLPGSPLFVLLCRNYRSLDGSVHDATVMHSSIITTALELRQPLRCNHCRRSRP